MGAPRDHKVELWTRQGDHLTRHVTEAEAAEYDELPFDDAANVAMTRITKEPNG